MNLKEMNFTVPNTTAEMDDGIFKWKNGLEDVSLEDMEKTRGQRFAERRGIQQSFNSSKRNALAEIRKRRMRKKTDVNVNVTRITTVTTIIRRRIIETDSEDE